jgi:glycosyltransferase involved in cell wall biosynthesis
VNVFDNGLLSPQPVISIVIPVRNEGQRLHSAVSSIVSGRSSGFPLQIVLVDDDSSDGCCNGLAEALSWPDHLARVDVLRLPRWSGIPVARNAGAAAAQAPILFISDANVLFPPNWDIPILERIASNRVLCATIADMDSPFRGYGCSLLIPSMGVEWIRDPRMYGGYVPISPCSGTAITADLFRRAGGYDTEMPVYGAAEPEFSVRLWLCGADIVSMPDLVLRHRFRPAAERDPFLDAISKISLRNYLRFAMLYLDQQRIDQVMHYYSEQSPAHFADALQSLSAGDVWQRRRLLEERLPIRFASFVERFGISDAFGQLAHN